jgi:hypothetical protein
METKRQKKEDRCVYIRTNSFKDQSMISQDGISPIRNLGRSWVSVEQPLRPHLSGGAALEDQFSFANFPKAVLDALDRGGEFAAVLLAITLGSRDESILASLIFYKRHPERHRRPLKKGDPGIAEWLKIRDDIVRPQLFRMFFAEYDFRFLPDDQRLGLPANRNMTQAQKDQRMSDLGTIAPLLAERAVARFDAAKQGHVFFGKPLSHTVRAEAKRLSSAQIHLIREFFSMPNGAIRWSAFQRAFEQFANGELRNPSRGLGAGEPDGGAQFLFAEFAWLCVESDLHTVFWEKALKTFVKTQEIFVHVYRPEPGSPSTTPASPTSGRDRFIFERYTFTNFRATRRFSEDKKRQLRGKYDRMTLSELRRAMRDHMRLAEQFNRQ